MSLASVGTMCRMKMLARIWKRKRDMRSGKYDPWLGLYSPSMAPPDVTPWPMEAIPVELFEIIASYLTRADVGNLRLVCREFESKVSAQYFRNVVVPFQSEIYGSLSRDHNGTLSQLVSGLFPIGTRMFESFGAHILRFALSLELDEDSLACPPVKTMQAAVPAFWGIYRWPHANYHRYTKLEGLEQTADEVGNMKTALRCLSQVRNIGLCCDAGLGFLLGPDQPAYNTRVRHPVFANEDWRCRQPSSRNARQPVDTTANMNYDTPKQAGFPHVTAFRKIILERMAVDAGYTGPQIPEAVRIMLNTELTNLANIDFDGMYPSLVTSLDPDDPLHELMEIKSSRKETSFPLIPASLTGAQKEMLLELEWAHRAMIQSYILGLIDNASNNRLQDLTTFSIAKIPGCHVHLFCRDDLWESMPSLKTVSIGIIADWRKITASTPGCIEDTRISPVESTGKAFTLLNNYIAKCRNIESLHFEWLCGGEFAPSSYQRNSYILPVPFVKEAELMIAPRGVLNDASCLLLLPYIKHLSLKNCWSSPHVFLQTVRQFALSSLEKLELESVSMSGPPIIREQAVLAPVVPAVPAGLLPAVAAASTTGLAQEDTADLESDEDEVPPNPVFAHFMQAIMPSFNLNMEDTNHMTMESLDQPQFLTWAGLVDHFSPGVKIRDLLTEHMDPGSLSRALEQHVDAVSNFIPDSANLRRDERKYRLRCLSVKSCGYVVVDTPSLDPTAILPPTYQLNSVIRNGTREFAKLMQSCQDQMLAQIAPAMKLREQFLLTNAFGMTLGWNNIYDRHVICRAKADCVLDPGTCRFSGEIESHARGLGR